MAIKVSIVVAVYNPGAHIGDLIASLGRQTMPQDQFETVFVDDDSTDGTRALLEELARERANVRVLHNSPNSGWPGKPRNIGIEASRGKYVFFVDHDDWLAPAALENLWNFAEENESDVVIPKEIGHGHAIALSAFRKTIPRAELGVDPVLHVPTPHKLFRRALLEQHRIRFPEGRVRLEDLLFIMQAYFAADVISIYSDHSCYHWVHRDRNNASLQPADPRSYYRDFAKVLDVVVANTDPGPLRETLFLHWYQRILLGRLGGTAFLGFSPEHQRVLYDEIRRIVDERFDRALDDSLPPVVRARAELLRTGDLELITDLARAEVGITTKVSLAHLRWNSDQLELSATAVLTRQDKPLLFDQTPEGHIRRVIPDGLTARVAAESLDCTAWLAATDIGLFVRDRVTQEFVELTVDQAFTFTPYGAHRLLTCVASTVIDPKVAFGEEQLPGISDVYFRLETCGWRSQRRVPFDAQVTAGAELSAAVGRTLITVYATQGTSNLSIKRSERPKTAVARPPSAARPRKTGPFRKVLRRARKLITD